MHARGEVVGSLCPALCIEKSIHTPACHTFNAGREAVFSMERDDGSRLVFKMSSRRTRVSTFTEQINSVIIDRLYLLQLSNDALFIFNFKLMLCTLSAGPGRRGLNFPCR